VAFDLTDDTTLALLEAAKAVALEGEVLSVQTPGYNLLLWSELPGTRLRAAQ